MTFKSRRKLHDALLKAISANKGESTPWEIAGILANLQFLVLAVANDEELESGDLPEQAE